jgi:serine protease Do
MKFLIFCAAGLLLASPAPMTKPGNGDQYLTRKTFTLASKPAMPAVVFLKVEINGNDQDGFGMPEQAAPFNDDLFQKFFGFPYGKPQQPQPQIGQGSGFLVSSDGYIMTNAHVVKGADKIEVTLHDGQVQEATLVGADPHTDIAVIKIEKIEKNDYPFLKLGDSDTLEVGEWVLAIGSPFQLQASVTAGIVSAKGRQGLNIRGASSGSRWASDRN